MENVIGMIRVIKTTLEGFEQANEENKKNIAKIEQAIKKELPYEIKSFLTSSAEDLSESTEVIFMGYEPIDLESLDQMYDSPSDKDSCLFLGGISSLTSDYIAGEDDGFSLIQDLNSEIEDGPVFHDLKNLVPIMSGDGYYIVLMYKDDGSSEIAIATEDYCLSSIAPNLMDYLFNMEVGVRKGVFEIDEDEEYGAVEVEAPEIWNEKLEAVA